MIPLVELYNSEPAEKRLIQEPDSRLTSPRQSKKVTGFRMVSFTIALGKCIHLLDPKSFLYVDVRMLMERYDDKPLSFTVFKIASAWADAIDKNVQVTNSLCSGFRQVVFSILIGLCFLILAFIALGVQFYLRGAQTDPPLLILVRGLFYHSF